MTPQIWFERNSHTFRITQLRNTATDAYINSGATVQVTKIVDEAGRQISGGVAWPVAFTEVSGTTTGEWVASVGNDVPLAVGRRYFAIIEVNPSGEPRGYAKVPLVVRQREG